MSALTRAMLMHKQKSELLYEEISLPQPGDYDLLIEIGACAVCRTDLHVLDADLKNPKLPLVPGHEIVGRVAAKGAAVADFQIGDRVAVPWLGGTCLKCKFCLSGQENLCDSPVFTGYTRNGGYAGSSISDARFSFKISSDYDSYSDAELAPLLCAGLIGWRCFKFAARGSVTANGRRLGLYGFGAAGHLILQVAKYFGWEVFAFTRAGDTEGQEFAVHLGATWAGDSMSKAAPPLDASIIFAPVGELVIAALRSTEKGGIVVCGGIHMSDIPQFSYDLLWEERSICSVANLTREDGREFFELAAKIPLKPEITLYGLEQANQAIADLRAGKLNGAAVLSMRDNAD